jgi:L,D-transpeptidase ErfK/SrfK
MFRRLIVVSSLFISSLVQATTFELVDDTTRVVGHNLVVISRQEDTLLDIGRQFDLGYSEIVNANPDIDPWLPGEGKQVIVPNRFILPDADRKGIVINLAEMRLYYYPRVKKGEVKVVITHPIGVGREGWTTPLGKTRIIQKKKDPTWTPPASIHAEHIEKGDPLPKVVPAGPDNPLGAFAMRLGMPGYLLHGTNRPYGVGMRVSHGCVRLYPEDIEHLFGIVPLNTPVEIVYQPDKAAIQDGVLFLEAHKVQEDIDEREGNNMTPMVAAIVNAQDTPLRDQDWPFVENMVRDYTGIVEQLNQDELEIVDNVWFIHSGLKKESKDVLRNTLLSTESDMYFWPMQNQALEEAILGPFDSYDQAEEVADRLTKQLETSVWPVLMSEEVL